MVGEARPGIDVTSGRPAAWALDPARPLAPAQREWIEQTLSRMSLRERVGQMVMIWVLGDYTSNTDPAYAAIRRQVREDGVGGLVMSLGSPIEVAAKINALQAVAKIPLLVGSDVEPNLGRLEGGLFAPSLMSGGTATVLPSNMAIGAGGVDRDAEEAGRIVGTESHAIGIHMAFAPVVDVNNNPSNPVINVRSFGEDPQQVARLSAAFIRGVQSAGVAATAKHFPGHGDTDVDSHLGLPVINVPRARLDSVELIPFRASVQAGIAGMMTAHIALPRAYGDSTPATLSSRVMGGLLRDTLGFRGLTVTDAMTMDGIARGYGVEQSALRAIEAGDDVLLMPPDVPRAIGAVVQAVEAGTIARTRIDASVRRILELKIRTGAISRPLVNLDSLRDSVGTASHWAVADSIATHGITLIRDSASLVPLARNGTTLVFTYAPDAELAAGAAFVAEARALSPSVRTVRVSASMSAVTLDSLAATASSANQVIVYSYTRTLEGEGRLAIPAHVAAFVNRLGSTGKFVVVAGGNPYQLKQWPSVATYLVTYGRGAALERAAARALWGVNGITGRAPVTLPGYFARGDGVQRPAGARVAAPAARAVPSVDRAMRVAGAVATFPAPRVTITAAARAALLDSMRAVLDRAVADSAFPGAYAAFGTIDGVVAEYGAGRLDAMDARRPDRNTVWDLASLTKVIGTTSALLQLVGQQRIALDSPLVRYLPDWTASGASRITVRDLMTHSAGLPAWRPLYKESQTADEAVRQVYATGPDTAVGARYLYSDLGFILLGKAVERITGMSLARYDTQFVFRPIGMNTTRYLPPTTWRPRIAPTEDDPWRGRKLRGEVHDENAARLDGISGHAGLFSTGADLARFARMYLGGGALDGTRVFDAGVVAEFTRAQNVAISKRALGWETPTGGNSSGTRLSAHAFGHTGFTGTSIWMDPEKGVFVILLTNRVNPTRENRKIGAVRIALADALVAAMGSAMGASSPPTQ